MLSHANEKYSVCKVRLLLFLSYHDDILYVYDTPQSSYDVQIQSNGKEIRPLETNMAVLFSFCNVFTR